MNLSSGFVEKTRPSAIFFVQIQCNLRGCTYFSRCCYSCYSHSTKENFRQQITSTRKINNIHIRNLSVNLSQVHNNNNPDNPINLRERSFRVLPQVIYYLRKFYPCMLVYHPLEHCSHNLLHLQPMECL